MRQRRERVLAVMAKKDIVLNVRIDTDDWVFACLYMLQAMYKIHVDYGFREEYNFDSWLLEKIDQWSLFSITSVGFMAINLLPVRMGEFVRPYLISQKSSIRLGSSLATIVVERVFDMLTLMIFQNICLML